MGVEKTKGLREIGNVSHPEKGSAKRAWSGGNYVPNKTAGT